MQLDFKACNYEEISHFINSYVSLLSSPIDSYVEDHILNAQHYLIEHMGLKIGYFSIYDSNLLTQFYIESHFRHLGQDAFYKMKKMQTVQMALVPTCDEFFLSHALDTYKSIDKQAYLFKDSMDAKEISEIENEIDLRLAEKGDIAEIIKYSGDFIDKHDERVARKEIYIASKGQEIVGYGIWENGVIAKEYVSIGMYTIEKYRQQGIGKDILLKLKKTVYENNKIPIAGCWLYNHNSKKTLEGAGFCTSTRLLKIKF